MKHGHNSMRREIAGRWLCHFARLFQTWKVWGKTYPYIPKITEPLLTKHCKLMATGAAICQQLMLKHRAHLLLLCLLFHTHLTPLPFCTWNINPLGHRYWVCLPPREEEKQMCIKMLQNITNGHFIHTFLILYSETACELSKRSLNCQTEHQHGLGCSPVYRYWLLKEPLKQRKRWESRRDNC